jgi:hypothetical protein
MSDNFSILVQNDLEHQKMMHSYERGHFSLTEFPAFAERVQHHFVSAHNSKAYK